jgi:hypothetical protein
LIPDTLIIIRKCILRIEDGYTIYPNSNVTESGGNIIAIILLGGSSYFESKVLIGGCIGISRPRTNVIAENTCRTYIHVAARKLNRLNITWNAAIALLIGGIDKPGSYFRALCLNQMWESNEKHENK